MFQSTHPRGVRLAGLRQGHAGGGGFNPRTREGCDQYLAYTLSYPAPFQSTHPRGVRHTAWGLPYDENKFQSTHPRGVRLGMAWPAIRASNTFQSTHPRGVRPIRCVRTARVFGFQSTHPRGVRRHRRTRLQQGDYVSIHAPARGATHGQGHHHAVPFCFNPRTREGCDRLRRAN